MKFFVGLNFKSRFPKPQIGRFFRSSAHGGQYVWRREDTDNPARLAELVNEAVEFLRGHNNPILTLKVYQSPEVAPVQQVPAEPPEDKPPKDAPPKELETEVIPPRRLQRKPREHPFG